MRSNDSKLFIVSRFYNNKADSQQSFSHGFLLVQSEFFITVNAITEYSTSDKNFVGTDFSLLKLLHYNGKHAYRHRQ